MTADTQRNRPQRIEAVLFDFDGTLSDTEPIGVEIDRETMAAVWGIHPSYETLHQMVGTDGEEPIPEIFAAYGIEMDGKTYWKIRGGNQKIYHEMPLELFEGAYDVLEVLSAQHIRLGLVSTTPRSDIEVALRRLHIDHFFECLVCGEEAGACKPSPEPYMHALDLMGLSPEHCLVVEDSPAGIASAHGADLYVVAYKGSTIEQDTSDADEEIFTYRELSVAEISA